MRKSTPPRVTLYGTSWCSDVRGLRAYLDTIGVRYTYIDIEQDEEAAMLLEQVQAGKRRIPTVAVGQDYRFVPRIWDLNVMLNQHGLLDIRAG
ncbi:glutaredoxin family protein [Deinococcus roseus]|uniref:NrdH-redoxin n=1 Tax=Deinococcus roseus TaxID=392414 RepID=A0ABQ2D9E8_9DEIO|nr:glutaredoxin domain-containing protein [Deinococcus roseus]GGJ49507.1 NrdH-redoxin [Deinococcus roseus]